MHYLGIPKVLHHHDTLDFWEFLNENYLFLTLVEIQPLGNANAMSTDPE